MPRSWVEELATGMRAAFDERIPEPVLERASVQLFDALACAAGAMDAPPVQIVHRVFKGSGPPDSSVFFTDHKVGVLDAVLLNGAAVRYLDLNDAFLQTGPGGHPSDNVVVAMAVGESEGVSGRDALAAIVLGYELFWRLRRLVYAPGANASGWDGTSVSGGVGALMSGLLLGLDEKELGHALAIGLVRGYGLKEIRRGSISMLKACGNALAAREGTLAALLAKEGMTGPREVLEGRSGLLNAFGAEPSADVLARFVAAPEWAIQNASIKMYPAIGTSQAAIHGAIQIAHELDRATEQITSVSVRVPASKATDEHKGIAQRTRPDSRESADHSIPFLVAVALEDGMVSHDQFEGERWTRPATLELMGKIDVVPEPSLTKAGQSCYPAIVHVETAGGSVHEATVNPTPGSPDLPWGITEVSEKFARTQRVGLTPAQIAVIAHEIAQLPRAPSLEGLVGSVRLV